MAYLDQLAEFLKENKIAFRQLDRYCQAFTHSSY
ncbi:ribonuclease III, partial [Turicibacter sanguinis]|nr:ribonuclease III [Turicibacter sanguinis]